LPGTLAGFRGKKRRTSTQAVYYASVWRDLGCQRDLRWFPPAERIRLVATFEFTHWEKKSDAYNFLALLGPDGHIRHDPCNWHKRHDPCTLIASVYSYENTKPVHGLYWVKSTSLETAMKPYHGSNFTYGPNSVKLSPLQTRYLSTSFWLLSTNSPLTPLYASEVPVMPSSCAKVSNIVIGYGARYH
jgi:hypothetical protein